LGVNCKDGEFPLRERGRAAFGLTSSFSLDRWRTHVEMAGRENDTLMRGLQEERDKTVSRRKVRCMVEL